MRIAIISSGFLPVVDGVTVAIAQRLRILSQRGHEVLLLCPDYSSLSSLYPNWKEYVGNILRGVRVVSLPGEPFMGVEFERNISRRGNRQLNQELQAFQPDVIHVDEPDRLFLGLLNAPGVAYARAKSIPCVGFYHTNFVDYIEDFFLFPRFMITLMQWGAMQTIRRVFHRYDATLVSSPVTQERVRRLGIRNIVCDRFLGVDLTQFHNSSRQPNFFQTQYGIENIKNKIKLTFLGRLTPDKGWRFTLQALAQWSVQPDNAPWMSQIALMIVGDGELRETIRDTLHSLGFTVHLLGRVPPEAVPPLLVNSDLHITTSEKETLGLTVLEAFAARIPVLAPRAGGMVTVIRDGENGSLFEPGDKVSFGGLLFELVANPELRHRLGQQGHQDVTAYTWDAAVTNLLRIWEARRV